jgi:hypothetical protein
MKKTILLLPLILLPAFGQNKVPKGGADNDSPIIVSDSSTNPLPTTKGPQTTAEREHTKGEQYFKQGAHKATVHDKENLGGANEKDSYRPACLVFSSITKPIQIPTAATSWSIVYIEGSKEVALMNWAASTGDIVLEGFNVSSTKAISAVKIKDKKMKVRIGDQDPNPTTVSDGGSDPLIKVHYCPSGPCKYCQNPDANGNCDLPVDPCK